MRTLYQRIRSLKASPTGADPDTAGAQENCRLHRFLPYVVVYSVKPEAVEILHIYHGAQDWR